MSKNKPAGSDEYEQIRLENIRKNNEILKSLGLDTQPIKFSDTKKSKSKPRSKPRIKREAEEFNIAPVRKSLRVRGAAPSFQIETPVELQDRIPRPEHVDQIDDKPFFNISEAEDKKLTQMTGKFNDFQIPIEGGTCKITKGMVSCIAVMPSTRLLAACGDRDGRISIWDIDDVIEKCSRDQEDLEPSIYTYKKHPSSITKLIYHPDDKSKLYSSAYDGAINCFDSSSEKCELIYQTESREVIGDFDIIGKVIWYSTHGGQVACLDQRANKDAEYYDVSHKKLNTIHFNKNGHNFCTGGLDGLVRVFDTRKMDDSISEFQHSKSVNAAFWDSDGLDILSTSFDDTLSIWKDALNTNEHTSIKHNNQTGRWIQKFRANWSSNSIEKTIVVGNMRRGIDLYDSHGRFIFQLSDEEKLTAIPAVNVFHPFVDMIISGNASGKMTIWMP